MLFLKFLNDVCRTCSYSRKMIDTDGLFLSRIEILLDWNFLSGKKVILLALLFMNHFTQGLCSYLRILIETHCLFLKWIKEKLLLCLTIVYLCLFLYWAQNYSCLMKWPNRAPSNLSISLHTVTRKTVTNKSRITCTYVRSYSVVTRCILVTCWCYITFVCVWNSEWAMSLFVLLCCSWTSAN